MNEELVERLAAKTGLPAPRVRRWCSSAELGLVTADEDWLLAVATLELGLECIVSAEWRFAMPERPKKS